MPTSSRAQMSFQLHGEKFCGFLYYFLISKQLEKLLIHAVNQAKAPTEPCCLKGSHPAGEEFSSSEGSPQRHDWGLTFTEAEIPLCYVCE